MSPTPHNTAINLTSEEQRQPPPATVKTAFNGKWIEITLRALSIPLAIIVIALYAAIIQSQSDYNDVHGGQDEYWYTPGIWNDIPMGLLIICNPIFIFDRLREGRAISSKHCCKAVLDLLVWVPSIIILPLAALLYFGDERSSLVPNEDRMAKIALSVQIVVLVFHFILFCQSCISTALARKSKVRQISPYYHGRAQVIDPMVNNIGPSAGR